MDIHNKIELKKYFHLIHLKSSNSLKMQSKYLNYYQLKQLRFFFCFSALQFVSVQRFKLDGAEEVHRFGYSLGHIFINICSSSLVFFFFKYSILCSYLCFSLRSGKLLIMFRISQETNFMIYRTR